MAPKEGKKRKLSGLSGTELQIAYDSLVKLTTTFEYESEEPNKSKEDTEGGTIRAALDNDFEERVFEILALFDSKLNGPHSFSFSSVVTDSLTKLNIVEGSDLNMKPGPQVLERAKATASIGRDELWSSDNLYRQLNLLEAVIPKSSEAGARAWIDTFFFRAIAMLPSDRHMILNMEHLIPGQFINRNSLVSLSGVIDYTAIVTTASEANFLRDDPAFLNVQKRLSKPAGSSTGLFVVEAKVRELVNHVPQAVAELYACAKHLKKRFVRGALTNGQAWIFLLLEINGNGNGATYRRCQTIELAASREDGSVVGPRVMSKPFPDLIAGILSHWIQNSFTDIASDDWFEVED